MSLLPGSVGGHGPQFDSILTCSLAMCASKEAVCKTQDPHISKATSYLQQQQEPSRSSSTTTTIDRLRGALQRLQTQLDSSTPSSNMQQQRSHPESQTDFDKHSQPSGHRGRHSSSSIRTLASSVPFFIGRHDSRSRDPTASRTIAQHIRPPSKALARLNAMPGM